jgi:pimeloyl-ACP methyl ester carboxylesterase
MFTPSHRAGNGPPLLCVHGFMDTWRTWEPPLPDPSSAQALADAVERAMDEAGFDTAHLVGNSLGGYVALQLAERGRAKTVVALAPAGGWAPGDDSFQDILKLQAAIHEQSKAAAPHTEAIVSTPDGRRRATQYITVNFEHIPQELLAHQLLGAASCTAVRPLIDLALRDGWSLEPQNISCPVRVVWGTQDALLKWPSASARYRNDWLPHADWVELDGVGHCPQLDVPLETAQLILGFTRR